MSPDRGHAYRRVAAGDNLGNPAAVRGRTLRETHMKTTQRHNKRAGFTLIEMVGVLAIIAILAALLVPKIFAAIQESRINNTVASINSVKAATMSYFAKHGGFSVDPAFDKTLMSAGELETPFKTRIGTDWVCEIVPAAGETGARFNLDGEGDGEAGYEVTTGSGHIVRCVLKGVNQSDAKELSQRIDGALDGSAPEDKGRVVYKLDQDNQGRYIVYVYLAHK